MSSFTVFRPIPRGNMQTTIRTAYPEFTASVSTYSASAYGAYNATYNYNIPELGTSTAYKTNLYDGSYYNLIWNSLNHLYYNDPYNPINTFEHHIKARTYKFLHMSASVFTIPQQYMGERIKPGTFRLTGSYSNTNIYYNLYDDGYGNLCDLDISTSSFASASKLLLDISFINEYRNCKTFPGPCIKNQLEYTSNIYNIENPAVINNITYTYGIPYIASLDGPIALPPVSSRYEAGISAQFQSGSSYIHIPHNENLMFDKNDSYSLSFWVKCNSSSLLQTQNYIFSKRGTESEWIINEDENITEVRTVNRLRSRYPISVYVSSSGQVVSQISDGTFTDTAISTALIGDDTYHHVVVVHNTTAATHIIYIDATEAASNTCTYIHNISNKSDIVIGALDLSGSNQFVGTLSEIKLYKYSLDTRLDTINSLYHNALMSSSIYQTNVVGNVFYRMGMVTISSPQPKYSDLFLFKDVAGADTNDWTISYRGEQKINETEVLVQIPRDSFNMTLNPTVLSPTNTDLISDELRTGSLNPYITQIGLYNEFGELLVVGKVAQAIQKPMTTDLNFILKWNT